MNTSSDFYNVQISPNNEKIIFKIRCSFPIAKPGNQKCAKGLFMTIILNVIKSVYIKLQNSL